MRRQTAAGREVGGRLHDLADPAPVRRRDARERVPPVDRLQQRRLLAVEVLVRAFEHLDLDAVEPARALDLVDRGAEPPDLDRERPLGRDDDLVGADRVRRDQRALDHLVGIVAQDGAVLERAGLAFGRVDDDRRALERRAVVAHGPPLASGGKSGAAPPPQAGGLELGDDLLGGEAPGGFDPRPPRTFLYSASDSIAVGYSTRCTSVMRTFSQFRGPIRGVDNPSAGAYETGGLDQSLDDSRANLRPSSPQLSGDPLALARVAAHHLH